MAPKPSYDFECAAQAAQYLKRNLSAVPNVAIFTGTGLGRVTEEVAVDQTVAYADIPNFPTPTVASHHGRLNVGRLSDTPVFVFQGRLHLYEGYTPQAVTFPIRVLQALDVSTVVLTNASGGLNPDYAAGDIMVIDDHINLTGENPLAGVHDDRWGTRFPEMINAYDRQIRTLLRTTSNDPGAACHFGTYVGLRGPSLETPAEMRYLRTIGADAVGFSTVLETIAAVHARMQVVGLSIITNVCTPDAPKPATVSEILATARQSAPQLGRIIANLFAPAGIGQ